MVDVARQERRRSSRRPLGIAVRVALIGSDRDFPCLCADLSLGGARLLVPAAMPAAQGSAVRITDVSGRIHGAGQSTGGEGAAAIVRVDRQTLFNEGAVTLGICFGP